MKERWRKGGREDGREERRGRKGEGGRCIVIEACM